MEYVLDTSVVIEKIASQLIEKKEISGKIIIPHAVMAELEHQANQGQEIGLIGLEEIQKLQEFSKKGLIKLEFLGERPNINQIRYAKSGEIDALIRTIAYNIGAVLITADYVLAESSKAFGLEVRFIEPKIPKDKIEIEKYFDNKTMSVHLRENNPPYAKKGTPGEWNLVKINDEILPNEKMQDIAKEIVERSKIDKESFIEISRRGSTIVQYKDCRIVIVKPPVSDGWEITAIRPIKKLNLDDYKLNQKIFDRIKTKAKGIIIAGEVGSGKSTFCQALAEFYAQGKIVKTVESPRDLQLINDITQYSKNFASSEEIHDILLLSRPDYVIFDEVRDTPDFHLYSDLRLSGSNVIGVLHAAEPIDSVQRFISRLDTGVIPSVFDTIFYINHGKVGKVLSLAMIVKVPSGMTEADLSRPIVEIRDFETNKLEYEVYSYGDETVVVPVQEQSEKKSPIKELASRHIEHELQREIPGIKAELVSDSKAVIYVPENDIGKVIGKNGERISEIEKRLGLSIDVQSLDENKKEVKYNLSEKGNVLFFYVSSGLSGKEVDFHGRDGFLFSARVGNKGEIKIKKKSKMADRLISMLNKDEKIILKI